MKFVCDDNLGRLARWLRTLGYDTVFDRAITDDRLLTLALTEDRSIVTRDRRLAEKTLARRVVLLNASRPLDQLREVLNTAGLHPPADRLFSRCPECNVPVAEIRKQDYETQIPPYVYRTKDSFRRCPDCGRIFWSGTHVQRMKDELVAVGILTA